MSGPLDDDAPLPASRLLVVRGFKLDSLSTSKYQLPPSHQVAVPASAEVDSLDHLKNATESTASSPAASVGRPPEMRTIQWCPLQLKSQKSAWSELEVHGIKVADAKHALCRSMAFPESMRGSDINMVENRS